jgi:triphosphatase
VSHQDQPVEIEIKLRVPPSARAAVERHTALQASHASAPQHRQEVTTYFDTPGLTLSRQGISLRVRHSGQHYVQTVKSAGDGHGAAQQRGEWEWPIAGGNPEARLAVGTPLEAALQPADLDALQPVFATEIHRTVWQVRLSDDTVAEIVLDLGRIVAGDASEPVGELELELKGGQLGTLYRLALDLAMHAKLAIEPASKAERGFRLLSGQPPQARKAPDIDFKRGANAAKAFERVAGSAVGHLLANVGAAAAGDVEGVHQARVAIRRVRAALVLFQPHLERQTTRRFNAELQRIGRVLGEARDWDVFVLETLPKAAADMPVGGWLDLLREAAEVKRTASHCAMQEELRGTAFTSLVLGMAAWVEDGARSPALLGDDAMQRPIAKLAPHLLDRMARKVADRGRGLEAASREDLHALRKSAKKLRYGIEFLSGLYSRKATKEQLHACKTLQEVLGEINDAAMTPVLAARLSDGDHAGLASAVGELAEWSAKRGKSASHQLAKAWHAFRQAERFWS